MAKLEHLGQCHHCANNDQRLSGCDLVKLNSQIFDVVLRGEFRQINTVKYQLERFGLFIAKAAALQRLDQAMGVFDEGCHNRKSTKLIIA